VAIVHGYAEHCGRYQHVAERLTAEGYAVHSFDLRGHGRSAGDRTLVHSFNEHLSDVKRFLAWVRERHAGTPVFLLGHSMGGMIATLYVIARQPELAGLILSGPALPAPAGSSAPLQRAKAFLRRTKPGAPRVLPAATISRDPEVVAAYESDPLVYRGPGRPESMQAGTRARQRIGRDMERISVPLMILHGTGDLLTSPAGSEALFARASAKDKTLKLYEDLYHEVFNEPEQDEVFDDLVEWLNERTAGQGTS
jgi:alpha-beta hydrolase superfamily lysophospholipase